ncbi:hypothetical protein [Polynucleobacter sp.]|jgi:hypothetical protein
MKEPINGRYNNVLLISQASDFFFKVLSGTAAILGVSKTNFLP